MTARLRPDYAALLLAAVLTSRPGTVIRVITPSRAQAQATFDRVKAMAQTGRLDR